MNSITDDNDGMPFDAWSFLRDVLSRGVRLEQTAYAEEWGYEFLSTRLDAVASELADKLKPHLKEKP